MSADTKGLTLDQLLRRLEGQSFRVHVPEGTTLQNAAWIAVTAAIRQTLKDKETAHHAAN